MSSSKTIELKKDQTELIEKLYEVIGELHEVESSKSHNLRERTNLIELAAGLKLELINTMQIEETDPEYVLVEDNPLNRHLIEIITSTDAESYFKEGGKPDESDEFIEISLAATTHCNATGWVNGRFVHHSVDYFINELEIQKSYLEKLQTEVSNLNQSIQTQQSKLIITDPSH
ncbi:hypothetical protein LIS04_159 [Listeria phage LIS04]|nr:hypothetical protein LIS04_159 [Listeria phage LIS04]